MPSLSDLPSVEQLLQSPTSTAYIANFGRPLVLSAIRQVLQQTRSNFQTNGRIPDRAEILQQVKEQLDSWTKPSLQPVINATGVILHTNLGRAPLSAAALEAIQTVALGYSNLEYDLAKGQRGSRLVHAEELLKRLTGAPSALVVNNNAAAVLLVLTVLAHRRAVVIARTQLVEIGGGFRIPDVMKQSGARLVEIGTTNRVHPVDYEQAIADEPVALILRAHRSNFRIIGFTTEPSLSEIVEISHKAGIPVVDDLGSGTLLDTAQFGLEHEPTISESLQSGADLVCFSGDKLLGGPQAGIIVGRAELVAKLKKHPLARAVRPDKLCLAALSATLNHYLKDEALQEIPIWKMIASPLDHLMERAKAWNRVLENGEVIPSRSTIGGGSLPEESLPTHCLALSAKNPNRFLEKLRQLSPAVIARLEDNRILFDPRTVLPEQDPQLVSSIQRTIAAQKL
jgi:L-seryl-tRNA(Ser) seleniumtransferase